MQERIGPRLVRWRTGRLFSRGTKGCGSCWTRKIQKFGCDGIGRTSIIRLIPDFFIQKRELRVKNYSFFREVTLSKWDLCRANVLKTDLSSDEDDSYYDFLLCCIDVSNIHNLTIFSIFLMLMTCF